MLEKLRREMAEGLVQRGERLLVGRVLEILERIGPAEAREILKRLAAGTPDARLAQDAKEAVVRRQAH
jgi:hypothetical protein